jgi:hypothetical protein
MIFASRRAWRAPVIARETEIGYFLFIVFSFGRVKHPRCSVTRLGHGNRVMRV